MLAPHIEDTINTEEVRNNFNSLIMFAAQNKASDVFINSDAYIGIKLNGKMTYLKNAFMKIGDVYNLIYTLAKGNGYNEFLNTSELNFMVEVPNVTYLRVNAYMQRGMPGLVMRLIPNIIPPLEDLNLPKPEVLKKVAMLKRGLVIVVGATGNGKSTTLASMIDYRNENSQNPKF